MQGTPGDDGDKGQPGPDGEIGPKGKLVCHYRPVLITYRACGVYGYSSACVELKNLSCSYVLRLVSANVDSLTFPLVYRE